MRIFIILLLLNFYRFGYTAEADPNFVSKTSRSTFLVDSRQTIILNNVRENLVDGQFPYPLHEEEHEIAIIILDYAYDAESRREDKATELVSEGFYLCSLYHCNKASLSSVRVAINFFEKALELGIPEYNGLRRAWFLSYTGRCYWEDNRFAEAIDYYKKALAITEFQGDLRALTLFRLGMIYKEENETRNMALECFKKAISIPECHAVDKRHMLEMLSDNTVLE
jgi:tetratricopeptide (TPR) repeat protein